MRDNLRALGLVLLLVLVLAVVAPGLVLGLRLADTWTRNETQSLLGGGLAICGGASAIVAVMVGAGAFARLAGSRALRREGDAGLPHIIDVTPAAPQFPPATPPWGLTGGGQYDLLPAPRQDTRYRLEVDAELERR